MTLVELAPPALAVALSPIPPIIAIVLLLQNDRPRASSIAYLLGRAAALTTLVVAFRGAPQLNDAVSSHLPRWTDLIVVIAGAVFILLGMRIWRLRLRNNASNELGKYHRIGGISPTVSAALGLFPPLVNPKVVVACIAADTHTANPDSGISTTAALACFVALASSTVAAPIVVYLVVGRRLDPRLEYIRRWIQHRQSALAAATLIAVGAAVVFYGLS